MIHEQSGNIHYVLPNAQPFSMQAAQNIFKDDEAAKKQKINRIPTLRHVARKFGPLYHRINLDPMIQSEHIITKQRLADTSTKGSSRGGRDLRVSRNWPTSVNVSENISMHWQARNESQFIAQKCLKKQSTTIMSTRTITQYVHQITELEATPSLKNCVSKIL